MGPKLCGKAGATITEDKVILTGHEWVEEEETIVRKIDIKDRIDHIVVVMLEIAHLITYWGGFMPTGITSRRETYRFSREARQPTRD